MIKINHITIYYLHYSTTSAFGVVRGGGGEGGGEEGGTGGGGASSLPPLNPGLEDLLAEKVFEEF